MDTSDLQLTVGPFVVRPTNYTHLNLSLAPATKATCAFGAEKPWFGSRVL